MPEPTSRLPIWSGLSCGLRALLSLAVVVFLVVSSDFLAFAEVFLEVLSDDFLVVSSDDFGVVVSSDVFGVSWAKAPSARRLRAVAMAARLAGRRFIVRNSCYIHYTLNRSGL